MNTELTSTPAVGRPRSERTRKAILRAARELMLERDISEISVEEIARRAGAGKATIYRWWGSKELLGLDSIRAVWEESTPAVIDSGTLEGDLLELILPWTRELGARRYGRVVASFIAAAQRDPEFAAAYRREFVAARRERGRCIFERAIARGEIAAATDVEASLDLIYGPVYHRLLHGHAAVDDTFVGTLVATVVAGVKSEGRRR